MILSTGSAVRVRGHSGFGYIEQFAIDDTNGTVLMQVQLFNPASMSIAPLIWVAPRDLSSFHSEQSTAKQTRAHADDHLLAAMAMLEVA